MRWPFALFFVASLVAPSARAQTNAQLAFTAEHWQEAAVALHDVYSSQTVTPAEKDLAQFRLGISLYRMGLLQPAYAVFAEIADRPNHAKFGETLIWLAKLSVDLPEAADVIERIGKYDDIKLAAFNTVEQHQLYWRLAYLSGRYAYRNARFDDATAKFERVDRASPLYAKAQIYAGMANVRMRHAVPAMQSFQRVVRWLDETTEPIPDAMRLRDLANLSSARTYYSAAINVGDSGELTIDATRLSAAAKFYRRVDVTGSYYLESVFEDAWTHFMAGDQTRALADLRMISNNAEAALLEGLILVTQCRWDDATTAVERMEQTYTPRRAELKRVIDALEKMDDSQRVQLVRTGTLPIPIDRMLNGYLEYEALLEAERKQFERLPASFRTSKLADDVRDDIALASDIEKRQIGDLTRERLMRAQAELDDHLRDAKKLTFEIVEGRRAALSSSSSCSPPAANRVTSMTLSWPINGPSLQIR